MTTIRLQILTGLALLVLMAAVSPSPAAALTDGAAVQDASYHHHYSHHRHHHSRHYGMTAIDARQV